MLIRIRIGKDRTADPAFRTGHKPLSLLYSLLLHAGVVTLLFLPPSLGSQQNSVYQSIVVQLEKDHKLIYYDFRKELPEVTASNATGKVTTPGPNALKSKQRIVAAPNEKPGKQLVYIPEPRVRLQTDITAPNLIAIETPLPDRPKPKAFQAPETAKSAPAPVTPLPNAPALAEAKPKESSLNALLNKPNGPVKQFTPPPGAKTPAPAAPAALPNAPTVQPAAGDNRSAISDLFNKPAGPPPKRFTPPGLATNAAGATPAALPNAPALAGSGNEKDSTLNALLNKPSGPVRQFTPPPQTGAGTASAPAALPGAPAVQSGGADSHSAIAALFNNPAGPPPKAFTAPQSGGRANSGSGSSTAALPAPPSVSSGGQPAAATVAILGLNPANVPDIPRPAGNRPARIEAGTPVPGATHAELGGGNSAISVPDLSIQGGAPVSPSTATRAPLDGSASEPATGLARPRAPQVLPTTPHVSVPLWPSNRSLPAAVEQHFRNRVVYTTLIPGADSGDDWVVWFAETAGASTDPYIVVHPPILLKAGVLPPFPAHSDHGTGTIRLTGIIHKDGRLDSLAELTGLPAYRELAEALQAWQFTPARRNNVAIDADTVIEIPVVFGKLSLR